MMHSKAEFLSLADRFLAHNYAPFPVVAKAARGCWVIGSDNEFYLDMLSSYSALNFGHKHPRIMAALGEQACEVAVVPGCFLSDEKVMFAKELADFCGMEMVLPMNSGAEAVETAIKLVRKWGYTKKKVRKNKAEIIVAANNFHGRTTTIVSFSTEPQYKNMFGPHTLGFKVVPFGDHRAFKKAVTKNTVAFLIEPIQGEGGIIVPPDDYLWECRDTCDEKNILMIADEIQTGLGRTGKMFACEWERVIPDIWILGKALGGGVLPISAVVSSREILEVFQPGDHGGTFGGNPLACHVAREALKVLVDENLAERANEMGKYFSQKLRLMGSPYIKEIRGRGLLIGIELKEGSPNAHELCGKMVEEGVLCKEADERTIRFAPPLIIKKEEIDWGMERIKKVLCP